MEIDNFCRQLKFNKFLPGKTNTEWYSTLIVGEKQYFHRPGENSRVEIITFDTEDKEVPVDSIGYSKYNPLRRLVDLDHEVPQISGKQVLETILVESTT